MLPSATTAVSMDEHADTVFGFILSHVVHLKVVTNLSSAAHIHTFLTDMLAAALATRACATLEAAPPFGLQPVKPAGAGTAPSGLSGRRWEQMGLPAPKAMKEVAWRSWQVRAGGLR